MSPDAQIALRRALEQGPGFCPPTLLTGPVPRIVLALKAHAATIAAARLRALEDSFPRTRARAGDRRFRARAARHLAAAATLARPLEAIGGGFASLWRGRMRDLAAAEWAWLESHGAPDVPALELAALAGRSEAEVEALGVQVHPAARLVPLAEPAHFAWDAPLVGEGSVLLISRPAAEVLLTPLGEKARALWPLLAHPAPLGALLAADQETVTTLVRRGALVLSESAR